MTKKVKKPQEAATSRPLLIPVSIPYSSGPPELGGGGRQRPPLASYFNITQYCINFNRLLF